MIKKNGLTFIYFISFNIQKHAQKKNDILKQTSILNTVQN